ncbi:MAG TPA: glycosyltransferase [Candidatus Magasanikbacteria bacterium]|nr:glycosyltransferase [Candidatus Magasanikbacteria bacterium]
MLISIIIPIYNEEENIPLLMTEFKKVFLALPNYQAEFIFVDDGSTDNSGKIIKDLAETDPAIKYLELSRNFGKEIATTAGFNFATGEAVIMIDADLQHPPRLIPEFLKKWEAGAEVVIGIKTSNKGHNFIQRFCSYLFYKFINTVANIKIVPHAADFRLLDKKVVIEFNRFTEKTRMTRALINWLGFKRDFVYFDAEERRSGKAKYSFFKLLHLAMSSFVALSILPLRLAGYLGLFTIFIFGSFGFYIFLGKYFFHTQFASSFSGTAQLAILLIFLVGVILSCLGLIALYIANVHNEVTNRPLYVIRNKKI